MPLPFAPPPKDSKVYRDLKNLKISSVTSPQLDTLKAELFAQGIDGSEDEMRRLKLLGEVSNKSSSSGPMPTTTIEQITRTSDTGLFTIFKPEAGAVFQFNGGDLLASGGTGACNFFLYDGSVQTYIGSASTSGQEPLPTDTYGLRTPFYVTSDMYFAGDITTIATSIRITAAFIRVR